MALKKIQPNKPASAIKSSNSDKTKHVLPTKSVGAVRFSIEPSSEIKGGDSLLQSSDKRRRYMRRGSKSPSMLALHAVRSSAEVAKLEAYDLQQDKLEHEFPQPRSLAHIARRSFSLPLPNVDKYSLGNSNSAPGGTLTIPPREVVEHDLARSLFHKTNLTSAQRRRLSLEILSRVSMETDTATM